jgi:hypothetical protein
LRRAVATLGDTAVRELHLRAARALDAAGLVDEAIEQYQSIDDADSIAEIVRRCAPFYIVSGRGRTIESWIERLPGTRIAEDGWLLHWAAASCLAHAPGRARELFERAYHRFVADGDEAGLYSACIGGIQGAIFESIDNARCDVWIDRCEELEAKKMRCPPPLLTMLATARLIAVIFRRPEPGSAWPARAMQLSAASSDVAERVLAGGFLALHSVLYEGLTHAAGVLEMLRASARAAESSGMAALTLVQSDALCAWAEGNNAACVALVREGLAMAARTGVVVWNDHLCAIGLAATLVTGDFEAARPFFALQQSSGEAGRVFAQGGHHFFSSWEAFLRGDLPRALEFADRARRAADGFGFPLSATIVEFARAQILWRMRRKSESRAALVQARERANAAGYAVVGFAIDLVESDHEWDEDRDHALACLGRGLARGRAGGYCNSFWLGQPTLARAAARGLEHGIERPYALACIAKHDLAHPSVALSPEGWPYDYRFRALGEFAIVADDGSSRRGRKSEGASGGAVRGMPLRLLAALIAFGGRGVRDTDVIDALWPAQDGDAARGVFDTTLHRLRRQLGSDDLVRLVDRRMYLDERRCWVDVWAIERAIEEAERLAAAHAPAHEREKAAAGHLLALYRGPLLAGVDDDWVHGPRRQLGSRFRLASQRLAAALEASGDEVTSAKLRHGARAASATE